MKLLKQIFKFIKRIFYILFFIQRRFRVRIHIKLKIKKTINKHPLLRNKKNRDKSYLQESRKFIQKYFPGYKDASWHYVCSTLNGIKSTEYIPEDIFFSDILPALNNKMLKSAYTDKTAYHLFFDKKFMPKTIFKILNGKFYTEDYELVEDDDAINTISKIDDKIVLKPAILSGGGENVVIKKAKEIAEIMRNNSEYKRDSFIIQEYIHQHEILKQFHPNSLNTLRIMTGRKNNEIIVLCSYFRTGRNNSVIDNGAAGGYMCGFSENGKLHKVAYDTMYNSFEKHFDTGIVFHGITIPGVKEAFNFCKKYHKKFPHFTIISWDIGINENSQPIFIEFNVGILGVTLPQVINGPIFGDNTEYFMEQYSASKSYNRLRISI